MAIYLILGSIAVLILGTVMILSHVKAVKYRNVLRETISSTDAALQELDGLLDIKHQFSDHESEIFHQKNSKLFETADRLLHSKFALRYADEISGLRLFCTRYESLDELKQRNNQLNSAYVSIMHGNLLDHAIQEMNDWTSCQTYFTESKKDEYLNKYRHVIDVISLAVKNKELASAIGHENEYENLTRFYNNIADQKKLINSTYRQLELTNNADYFDHVLRFPLSEQQRSATVYDEDNVLVISSAGSGKTFTMEGNVKYLIEKRGVNPEKILLLTFTRKAAEALHKRVGVEAVTCSTFDALAYKIVTQREGHPPTISDDLNVRELVFHELISDKHFIESVARYLMIYATDPQAELEVENPEELVEIRRSTDRRTLLPCMDGSVVFTKSEQERIIGDILSRNGVNYRYEEGYEYNVSDLEHRQYKPDFSIHYDTIETIKELDQDGNLIEKEHTIHKRIYLEHFGIDPYGCVPKWFAGEGQSWEQANTKYHEGINWKRRLHADKGTVLIETTSGDFQMLGPDGVEKRLLNMLRRLGVPINPLTPEKIFDLINDSNPQRGVSVKQMLSSFVSLLKGGCHDLDAIIDRVKQDSRSFSPNLNKFLMAAIPQRQAEKAKLRNHLKTERDLYILENMVRPYYTKYQETLKSRGEMDFTDMVIAATQFNESSNHTRYDYILIDEFQDLSIARYKFVQSLRSDYPFRTKLFCVGDDWQSIYRFAGSDLSLFNDFSRYFGYVEQCKIEKTYRFGEPLMSLSSAFVMENPFQIKKNVTGLPENKTELTCIPYQFDWRNNSVSKESFYKKICDILNHIPTDESVLFLGRYSFDISVLKDSGFHVEENHERRTVHYGNKQMSFLTVHQSKGLESDHIILLNCNDGTYGFPSAIEDDPILSYVLSDNEQFKFAEERRLFYVAITRAKKHTYILYDENRPSYFIHDFIERDGGAYGFCPLCHTGHVVKYQQKTVRNGNVMTEFRCSNERYGCTYNHIHWENRTQTSGSQSTV